MKLHLLLSACMLMLGSLPHGVLAEDLEPGVEAALDQIRPGAIRAHVRFLADDLLEGRGPGTRGYDVAAKYVAAKFEELGLEPAGGNSSYFQPVPLRKVKVVESESTVTLDRNSESRTLTYAEDCLVQNNYQAENARVTAPVVFAGFGVTSSEPNHDDYADINVENKIVAILYGAPSSFPPTLRAHHSSRAEKLANAAAHGAIGVLDIYTPADMKRWPWEWIVPQRRMGGMCWLDSHGTPHNIFWGFAPEVRGVALLSETSAEWLLEESPQTLSEVFSAADGGTSKSFNLGVTATIRTATRHEEVASPNVVAALRGSDENLRNEYVVFCAHLDHLGKGEPIDGDGIYNGALDNASGVAALLEIAKAFSGMPKAPRRSVLFLAATGEETGLLGSDFFAQNPAVPRDSIVANINIDAIMLLHPFLDVILYGEEHSTLGLVARQAASKMGIKVIPDPVPDEVFFVRSDQYSFVRQGVPSLATLGGRETGDPQSDGIAIFKEWIQTLYHTPKDDLSQPLNFEGGAKQTQLCFLIGYEIAVDKARPRWNEGDFFGDTFGRVP